MRTRPILLAMMAWVSLAVCSSFAQDRPSESFVPRSQYSPMAAAQAQGHTQQPPDTWYDFLLKQFNPGNVDYGKWMVLIPMKVVSDSDLIPVAHSDAKPVTVPAKRRGRRHHRLGSRLLLGVYVPTARTGKTRPTPWVFDAVLLRSPKISGIIGTQTTRRYKTMPCPRDPSRTDFTGRAYAGSQRQIQTYVNERTSELCQAVAQTLKQVKIDESAIRWVSPLAADSYSEYQDEEFLRIIGAEQLAKVLADFWPRGGPCWDALARLDGGGCILVEAKSHVSEVYGNGCGAKGDALVLIQSSVKRAKDWLGAGPDADWLGRLYQSANRLAHLYFLREVGKVGAYLVNIYFTGDPHSPTSRQQWDKGIKAVKEELGIPGPVPYSASAFLEAPQ